MIQVFLVSNFLYHILLIRIGGMLLRRKNRKVETIPGKEISVVIPFRDERMRIDSLLNSIHKLQNFPLEFIFVNDHSDDDTLAYLKSELHAYFSVKILSLPDGVYGKKEAIRIAVTEAKGNYILTWDADVCLSEEYFNKFSVPKGDLVILPVRFNTKNSWQRFLHTDVYSANALNYGVAGWIRPLMCSGANLLIRKAVFLEMDTQRNDYTISGGDDMFLLKKMIDNGKNIAIGFSSKHAVETQVTDGYMDLLSQRNRWISKTKSVGDKLAIGIGVLGWLIWMLFVISIGRSIYFEQWSVIALCLLFRWFCLWVANYSYYRMLGDHSNLIYLPLYDFYLPIQALLMLVHRVVYPLKWKGRKVILSR